MLETALALSVACVALIAVLFYRRQAHQHTKEQLKEYKSLFELSDSDCKVSQNKVQNLLEASTNKDVLLERGVNALTVANGKLKEQVVLVGRLATEVNTLRQTIEFQEGQYTKLMSQKKPNMPP